eukprot:scaffold161344_cov32-Tisochrysis_lutea.AAC.2
MGVRRELNRTVRRFSSAASLRSRHAAFFSRSLEPIDMVRHVLLHCAGRASRESSMRASATSLVCRAPGGGRADARRSRSTREQH